VGGPVGGFWAADDEDLGGDVEGGLGDAVEEGDSGEGEESFVGGHAGGAAAGEDGDGEGHSFNAK
jgi:hypothetical protein